MKVRTSRNKDKEQRKKGFTLIELIIVIAVLAILAAVAIPSYLLLVRKADTAVEVAAATEYAGSFNLYNAMNPMEKIVGTEMGTSPTGDDVYLIKTEGINPVTDFTDIDLVDRVLSRINIDADGLAIVSNKEDIP
ncbi:MAG: prepilin-type N-terminal cleavage/methylation domain-containing protein [Saccharofermentanales bacterium]